MDCTASRWHWWRPGWAVVARRWRSPASPGVKMGQSYAQVLAVVSRNNAVTKRVEGEGFGAGVSSPLFEACRIKYLLFQGAGGLQMVKYEPAPQLSVNQNCRQP